VVTSGHVIKDGGHTSRSAIAKNPMLHANFVALCCIEPELLLIEVLHCGSSSKLSPVTLFVHQGYRVKVKVTGAKTCLYVLFGLRISNAFIWNVHVLVCRYICGITRSRSYIKVIRSRSRDQKSARVYPARGWSAFDRNAILFDYFITF